MPIDPWKGADNFSKARHQELVDGLNSMQALSPAGSLNVIGTPFGRGVVDTSVPLGILGRPLQINSAGGSGVYGVAFGKPKSLLSLADNLDFDALYDFTANIDAYLVNEAEKNHSATHYLDIGSVWFGHLTDIPSASGLPVYVIPPHHFIRKIRHVAGDDYIQKTYSDPDSNTALTDADYEDEIPVVTCSPTPTLQLLELML